MIGFLTGSRFKGCHCLLCAFEASSDLNGKPSLSGLSESLVTQPQRLTRWPCARFGLAKLSRTVGPKEAVLLSHREYTTEDGGKEQCKHLSCASPLFTCTSFRLDLQSTSSKLKLLSVPRLPQGSIQWTGSPECGHLGSSITPATAVTCVHFAGWAHPSLNDYVFGMLCLS